jgi:serine/threonine-protein kinase
LQLGGSTIVGESISHYKVLEKIGEGGMGEVYRATDTKLNRDVALKILPEQFASDAQRMGRFQREAEVLASLDHPNIGQIYGIEDAEAGATKALVLQLIEGPTLAERIAQGPIPVEEALKIALQIAEGLEAAHEKGVIHRDLKPANIKVTPEGQVKILDFGLAKALEGEAPDSSLSQSPTLTNAATQAGVILGTAAYMSPEQARGKPTDRRADIWAIGIVLFEMLSGKRAFEGEDVSQTLAAVIMTEPDWSLLPSETPAPIRRLLQRCLDREPHDRLQAIGEFRIAVCRYLADPSDTLGRPVADAVQAPPQSKLPWVTAIVLGIVVAGVAGWSLKPEAPGTVSRFSHVLPEGQQFPTSTSSLIAVSPDGSRMVYVANRQLYVRAMDALDSIPIPGTDENPRSPFFSPDGQWIGYWTANDSLLKKIPISGGASVTLSEITSPFGTPFWGADDTIVFGQPLAIMRVSANGGTPELMISASAGGTAQPQILPGGSSVLFTGGLNMPFSGEAVVHSLESGENKVLFAGVYAKYVSTGHIVYTVDDVLFAVPFDLDTMEVVGGPVPIAEGVRAGPPQYVVSESGSLGFVPGGAVRAERGLALVDQTGEVERLNVPPKQYLSPRLSPDGQSLLVQSVEDSENVIWVYDLTGDSAIRRITFQGEGKNHRPIWTPDSQHVTFSSDRDGPMSLYWMPADGSGTAERLTSAEEGTSHWPGSWSPDGETLAYMIERERNLDWDIWLLSHEDQENRILYDEPGKVYIGPEFSPDGKWLTYASGEAAALSEVYLEPFPPTGARWRLSQGGGVFPVWSRNGKEILFRPTTAASLGTLKSVDVVTDPEVSWANEQILPVQNLIFVSFYRDYDTSQDGQILTVVPVQPEEDGEQQSPQVVIVLNWFEELKARVPVP